MFMEDTKHEVLLFQDDSDRIQDWVLRYPDRETGGQFFGLWTHSKNPYINVVIGPGKDCRHETHSFYQDVKYLKQVGEFLNGEFKICHIGEWHSHHRLRLRQPSSGDLNSVWKHFPSGVEYFLLVIATIEAVPGGGEGVKLWPHLFQASTHTVVRIKCKIIKKCNVFMDDEDVRNRISDGAERIVNYRTELMMQAPSNETTLWFQRKREEFFFQNLNSQLEKLVDEQSKIDKTLEGKKTLVFSFRHHGYRWVFKFSSEFPKQPVKIRRETKDFPLSIQAKPNVNVSYEGLVDTLVETVQNNCPAC